MSLTAYYLAWLAAGLAACAAASALITRHLRRRLVRRQRCADLLEALSRYSAWVAAQQHTAFFQGDVEDGDTALLEVRNLQREWFPELSQETSQLFESHTRLIDFLWAQQVLRLQDAEAWLESAHNERFAVLCRMHRQAAQAFCGKLGWVAEPGDAAINAGTAPAA